MTPDQIITDVETVARDLARLRQELDRTLGRLADTELQLKDVRTERDQEHEHAEALQTERDREHQLAEALKTALANSAAIEQAIGIIAEKAGVSIPEARAKLKERSSDTRQTVSSVAERIIAGHEQAHLGPGDPEVARLLAAAGIPAEFWKNLTLNGAIFE